MSKLRLLCMLFVLPLAAAVNAADPSPVVNSGSALYNVGESLTPDEISAIDLSVLPNGAGLPEGKGTAREGAKVYAIHCAACHGDDGEGRGDYVALVGGRGTLASDQPLLTVGSYWPIATTLFDYIRRAMPYNTPGVLTPDEIYAVSAWILQKNEILAPGTVLNRRNLSSVRMPNRDGFIRDPRPDVASAAVKK